MADQRLHVSALEPVAAMGRLPRAPPTDARRQQHQVCALTLLTPRTHESLLTTRYSLLATHYSLYSLLTAYYSYSRLTTHLTTAAPSVCLTAPRPSLHLLRVRVGLTAPQPHWLAPLAHLLTTPTRYNPNRTTTFSDQQVKAFPWVPLRPAQVGASTITTAPHPLLRPLTPLPAPHPSATAPYRCHGPAHVGATTASLTHSHPPHPHAPTLSCPHALTHSLDRHLDQVSAIAAATHACLVPLERGHAWPLLDFVNASQRVQPLTANGEQLPHAYIDRVDLHALRHATARHGASGGGRDGRAPSIDEQLHWGSAER